MANSTLVVTMSDHGFHLGEQKMFAKRTLFERGTQVPLMIRSPWHPKLQNLTTSLVVELVDVAPTILDFVDVLEEVEESGLMMLHGQSWLPFLDALQNTTGDDADDELKTTLNAIEQQELAQLWESSSSSTVESNYTSYNTGVAFSQYARCGKDGTVDCDTELRHTFFAMGYAVRTPRWRYTEWYRWNKHTLKPRVDKGIGYADLFEHSLGVRSC